MATRLMLCVILLCSALPGCGEDRPSPTATPPTAKTPCHVEQVPRPTTDEAHKAWDNYLVFPGRNWRVLLGETTFAQCDGYSIDDGIRKDSVRAQWLDTSKLMRVSWSEYGHGSGHFNVVGQAILQIKDGQIRELFRDHSMGFARAGWCGWTKRTLTAALSRDGKSLFITQSMTDMYADEKKKQPLSHWTRLQGYQKDCYVQRFTKQRIHKYRVLDGRLEHVTGWVTVDLDKRGFPVADVAKFFDTPADTLRRLNPSLQGKNRCSGRLLLANNLPPCRTLTAEQAGDITGDSWEDDNVVHVFVALCDNKHQGIVRVPAALGNGQEPKGNLYWGAMYGVKTFFKKSSHWAELPVVRASTNPAILERCAFKGTVAGKPVWVVASAYDGRRMKAALRSFLHSAAGQLGEDVTVKDGDTERVIQIGGTSNLVCFVGHNGFMDGGVPEVPTAVARGSVCSAVVLACRSRADFGPRLKRLGCPALITTTGLMAPEAYTLDAIIRAWAAGKEPGEVRDAAAGAYAKYQNISISAARRLFATRAP
jgi:hypothetical protein